MDFPVDIAYPPKAAPAGGSPQSPKRYRSCKHGQSRRPAGYGHWAGEGSPQARVRVNPVSMMRKEKMSYRSSVQVDDAIRQPGWLGDTSWLPLSSYTAILTGTDVYVKPAA